MRSRRFNLATASADDVDDAVDDGVDSSTRAEADDVATVAGRRRKITQRPEQPEQPEQPNKPPATATTGALPKLGTVAEATGKQSFLFAVDYNAVKLP